ncbi:Proton/glutamate symporter @ Sodium/glutamate symporter [hydrothermal vent metagenome]|uniref:Proton/glutamate symporter @ Sodium/glutamate symporter n=1 Tax=hydrothermal vent metagenome TaxID=652676 RepID=A0A3B0W9U5_9ZZZZ
MTLTKKIIILMVLGAVVGLTFNLTGWNNIEFIDTYVVGGLFHVVGQLFINSLKMIMIPLVFVSLFCGTTALRDPAMLGKIGGRTLAFYLMTTAIALVMALSFALMIEVGAGADITKNPGYVVKEGKSFIAVILSIIDNPVKAMAEGNLLAVIMFSILLGLSSTFAGKPGEQLIDFFNSLNAVIMKLVMLIMHLAPYAVFAILAKVCAELGINAIKSLTGYFFTVLSLLIFHALVVYPLLLKLLSGLNPLTFLKKMESAVTFAFGTSSSNATIPVTLRTVTERMGVKKSVASFTVPFGATINMDGTAIMQGVATVFIANAYGVDLSNTQLMMVVLMATMASIGSAGVPSAGLVMLQAVLYQAGLPVEGIGLILGIDRLLDMTRTAVNITGDAAVTCIVAKSQNQFDQTVFDDPEAGVIKE